MRSTLILLGSVALLKIILHAFAIQEYGYFRDELYYLASTRHLDLGYVDHPPLSIYLLAAQTALFGDSLIATRALSILAGGAMVLFTGLIARELGGRLVAQGLASLAMLVAPVLLGSQHFYSMNVFDQLLWTLSTFVVVRTLKSGRPHLWLLLGVLIGLGLFNKISIIWLSLGLSVGLLLTPHRRWLKTRWPWIAAAIAIVFFLPYLIWQVLNGYPTLEFMANAAQIKMVRVSILDFFANQFLAVNPVACILYVAGIAGLLFIDELRQWRVLGITALVVAGILLVSGTAKTYYLAAAYPLLVAPGGCALEKILPGRWRSLHYVYAALLLSAGVVFAPLAIPLLPAEEYRTYAASLGISPRAEERSQLGELPQHFADMFGWEELAEKVARVYHSLPPEDQKKCIVFGQNYGEAGAIDVLGRRLGLPGAISGHNSYWMWGPGNHTGEVVVIIGGDPEGNARWFEMIEQVDVTECRFCMPYERGVPIFVARKMKRPLRDNWARLKAFI
jgi:4-amino-4-deoxy-L-arabinose transferase-like glycosyltransferase